MKRFLLAVFALCCALSSCSKDDNTTSADFEPAIVGTWWNYETYDTEYDDVLDHRTSEYITRFTEDGEWTDYEGKSIVEGGSYKIQGSKLILYNWDGRSYESLVDITIIKIDGDYMELEYVYKRSGGKNDPPLIYRYKLMV